MRSFRWALIMVALVVFGVGCFSDRGIAIEIDVGATGATSVELYVGNRRCTDPGEQGFRCDGGIAPPSIAAHLDGDVWYRDDVAPYFAVVSGGKATFRLQADMVTTLPIAIAVGSTGPGTPALGTATLRDVTVPVDDARIVRAELVASGEVRPSTDSATTDRAMVWNQRETPASSCVVVEHWTNGEVERDFIVPPDDPDCDSVKEECDPGAYLGSRLNDRCLIKPPNDATHGACRLGAFGCTDERGPRDMCMRLPRVCVPKAFCDCPLTPSAQPSDDCLEMKASGALDEVSRIVCTVRLDPGNSLRACKDKSDPIDLGGLLGNDGCKQPEMSLLRADELAFPTRSRNFGGVDLELINKTDACGFVVQVNSGRREIMLDRPEEFGIIRLDTDDRVVLLPIVVRFVLDSGIPSQCAGTTMSCTPQLAADDPMWACAP